VKNVGMNIILKKQKHKYDIEIYDKHKKGRNKSENKKYPCMRIHKSVSNVPWNVPTVSKKWERN
jgi:hypothetical protein